MIQPRNHPGKTLSIAIILNLYAGSAKAETVTLEELVVTAQKRVENVQEIPITISVVTGSMLDNFSIRDANDLADSVPGLTIQHTPQNLSQVAIRGMGTGSGGESLDQSVGLFIDGIWAGRIREFQTALFDIERVEVIKGTQTTLLGKNTSLGAVSIVTRRPEDELGGFVQGDYEFEFESTYLTGALNIPTQYGNYRLAINDVTENGYVTNKTTGNEVPERKQNTARISGEYELADNGKLLLSYQYDDLKIRGDTFQPDNDELGFLAGMDLGTDIGIDQTKHAYTSYGRGGESDDTQESKRAIANYDHSFGDYLLTSLTGWSQYDNDRRVDTDFMAVDYLNTAFSSEYKQFSQEFRIASPTGKRFEYVAGLYYLDGKIDYSSVTDVRFPPPYTAQGLPLDSTSQVNYDQDTEVWSLFGQGTLYINEPWRVTVGLRYTDEQKDAHWGRVRLRSGGPLADIVSNILAPEAPSTPLQRSEDNLDGSVNVQYDISDNTMSYISWATGSKSGGFAIDVATPDEAEFDTEEAETVELGIKMNLADGAAILNTSLFYTEIQNFQVISFVGTGFQTFTVPAETQGLEFETQWAVTPNFTLGAGATYSDAQQRNTGMRLPYAPKWSTSLNALYQLPWQQHGLVWRLSSVLNYRSKQYMQADERIPDNALTLLDMRLALASIDDGWEVALMGRNLLDEETSFGFDFPFFGGMGDIPVGAATIGSLNRPLTIALQARYGF